MALRRQPRTLGTNLLKSICRSSRQVRSSSWDGHHSRPLVSLPYLLTLHGYGFYWFQLTKGEHGPAWHDERLPRDDLPVLVLLMVEQLFPERVAIWRRDWPRASRALEKVLRRDISPRSAGMRAKRVHSERSLR